MSLNPYKQLLKLLPGQPVDVGEVAAVADDGVLVELLNGSLVHVRGEATVGDHVYIKDGAIEGPAPDLVGHEVEI